MSEVRYCQISSLTFGIGMENLKWLTQHIINRILGVSLQKQKGYSIGPENLNLEKIKFWSNRIWNPLFHTIFQMQLCLKAPPPSSPTTHPYFFKVAARLQTCTFLSNLFILGYFYQKSVFRDFKNYIFMTLFTQIQLYLFSFCQLKILQNIFNICILCYSKYCILISSYLGMALCKY